MDKTILLGQVEPPAAAMQPDAERWEQERAAATDAIARLKALQEDAEKRVEELTAIGARRPVSPRQAPPSLRPIEEEREDDVSRRNSMESKAVDELDKTIVAEMDLTQAVADPAQLLVADLPTRTQLPTQPTLPDAEEAGVAARDQGSTGGSSESQEEVKLREALAQLKRDNQQLSQELSKAKHEAMMQAIPIEGALDETKRMIQDHLDETQKSRGVDEHAVTKLRQAAALARQRMANTKAKLQTLERTCGELKTEVFQAETDSASKAEDAERSHADRLASDLSAARARLAGLQQRLADAREAAATAQAEAIHTRQLQDERESVFRHKLEELHRLLWHAGTELR